MGNLTAEQLHEFVTCDLTTGTFIYRVRTRRHKPGDALKPSINKNGYAVTQINGTLHYVHRLVWLYAHGEWPSKQIDHINRNRSDNRLENLRLATSVEQGQNTGIPKNNTSGYKGVWFHKPTERYVAEIKHRRKKHHLGYFNTVEEAATAYQKAKAKIHTFHPT